MAIENQYPIGLLEVQDFSDSAKESALADIRFLPNAIEAAITNLDEAQLQTPYREGGWTVHQLVHHVADSHINAYVRFKLCLTEDRPVIKPYGENLWAQLDDVKNLPVNISITLLFALHSRWISAIEHLADADWQRTAYHPESKQELSLWYFLQSYAWHGRHHVAQINGLRTKMGWH
ncbi:YfiT family bacillithiol transferase [Niabella insulamsoli]|uniref:YfiT family bacillithiol transferase n=1 Tax=Niabella insulamsoli TaxID=3144874 RepID=UPI0031FE39AA